MSLAETLAAVDEEERTQLQAATPMKLKTLYRSLSLESWRFAQSAGELVHMGKPNSSETLVEQFKNEYYEDDDSVVLPCKDDLKCMRVKDPAVLASFVAFCSKPNTRVVFRGSTNRHQHSVPSLFRDGHGKQCSSDAIMTRWRAYRCLIDELHQQLKGRPRWNNPATLGSILQHYGIKTPWLDVVRNLYTAIWFATHEVDTHGNRLVVTLSDKTHGHIAMYRRPEPDTGSILVDLWDNDSSRHLRPHAQHGLSLAKQCDDADVPSEQQDFREPHRIAQVCFPNSLKWSLCGYMFSARFLFPDPEHDDSLKQLCCEPIENTLTKVRGKHGVDLGIVTRLM